jgi:hypothetical protein
VPLPLDSILSLTVGARQWRGACSSGLLERREDACPKHVDEGFLLTISVWRTVSSAPPTLSTPSAQRLTQRAVSAVTAAPMNPNGTSGRVYNLPSSIRMAA